MSLAKVKAWRDGTLLLRGQEWQLEVWLVKLAMCPATRVKEHTQMAPQAPVL